MQKFFISLIVVCLCLPLCLQARQPYHAKATVDNQSATVSASNLTDLSNDLKTTSLEQLIPIYTPTSAVSIGYNLRELLAQAAFAANSTVLVVTIPNAGITTTFDGGTRDQSLALFKDFIKEGSSLPKILKGYARYSPIDPIAGNPNSLMAQMGQADYLLGQLSPLTGCECSWESQPIKHQFQAGLDYARTFTKGYETTQVTVPLRYSYSPDLDWALILDAPITYNRNDGASSLLGSLGIAFRFPISYGWSLTPVVRLGFGGSLDLCTAGTFISAGLNSTFNYKVSDYILSMTNYAAYFTSTNFWLTGVNFNYHLHNSVIKNGISITSCNGITLCDKPLNFKLSFVDSYFGGDKLFIRHYDEVAVSLITNNLNPCLCYDSLSIELAYQFGYKNYKGYFINMVYQF